MRTRMATVDLNSLGEGSMGPVPVSEFTIGIADSVEKSGEIAQSKVLGDGITCRFPVTGSMTSVVPVLEQGGKFAQKLGESVAYQFPIDRDLINAVEIVERNGEISQNLGGGC